MPGITTTACRSKLDDQLEDILEVGKPHTDLLQLKMELCPDKPFVRCKYCQLKMYLIYLTHLTS